MKKDSKIYIAGHRGLVGSAIERRLRAEGFNNLIFKPYEELDLCNQRAVQEYFKLERPEFVFLAAAKVGGILANSRYQADFIYENLMIAANVIRAAFDHKVEKLLFLGSSCIYPKLAPQPIKESSLLTGPLETTNEGYALAKIAGLKLCEHFHNQYGSNFISAMPTNLYGIEDNFHPENSHVIPGLMRRFHEKKKAGARELEAWGTGKPRREFLNVDDLAEALLVLMQKYNEAGTINVGVGQDHTIAELVQIMKEVVGFEGEIKWDTSKPDGTPQKLLDVSRINALGWKAKIGLRQGLERTYQWALANKILD